MSGPKRATSKGLDNMPATATASATCDRCNGSGQYHGTRRDGTTYIGSCFACQRFRPRGGFHRGARPAVEALQRFTTAPALGDGHHRGLAATMAQPVGEANWQRFAAQSPTEAAWLASPASGDFGASLIRGCRRYGGLTPRQLAAVQRNLTLVEPAADVAIADSAATLEAQNRAIETYMATVDTYLAERVAPAAESPYIIDMSQIFAAFDTAAGSGLRKVRLTLGTVEFKRTGSRFRHGEGLVMCYSDGVYRGYVTRDNVFHKGLNAVVTGETIDRLRTAAENPRAAASTHGHDTGYCSCCRRLLTDPPSVMAGIGPVCIRRFGWSF